MRRKYQFALAGAALIVLTWLARGSFYTKPPNPPLKSPKPANAAPEGAPRASEVQTVGIDPIGATPGESYSDPRTLLVESLQALVDYHRKHRLDKLYANVAPETMLLANGVYLSDRYEEHRALVLKFRKQVWRGAGSFESFLTFLRTLQDTEFIRTAILYSGGRNTEGNPRELTGGDLAFGHRLMQELYTERNPWIRIALMRGVMCAGEAAYDPQDLLQFAVFHRNVETLEHNIFMAFGLLADHLTSSSELRDMFIQEAVQGNTAGPSRIRQLQAARGLFDQPGLRDNAEVARLAGELLGRLEDAEIQDRALLFLNTVGNPAPALTDSNPIAISFLQVMKQIYTTMADRPGTSDPVRREILRKITTYDSDQAAAFVESLLRDPRLPAEHARGLLDNLNSCVYHAPSPRYSNSASSWARALEHVAAAPEAPPVVQARAWFRLQVYNLRQASDAQREVILRDFTTSMELRLAVADPDAKAALEAEAKHARLAGVLK